MTDTPNPDRMTTQQAADYLGFSSGYLVNLRSKGEGPAYYKLGGVFYRQTDLDAFIESKKVTPGEPE